MIHRLAVCLLLLAASPITAQPLPAPRPAASKPAVILPTVPRAVAALRDAALEDNYAWDIVEGLTTEVGQRLAGTEAEARARQWAVSKLRSLGFANARIGPRRQGPSIASRKGALAIVIRSIGTDHHRNPHTGAQRFDDGVRPIPVGALSIPDAEQLQRILKRGKPVTMRLTLVSTVRQGESGNVIAEVPGRDPGAPIVLVGGHLDSWDLGTGAIDDAAGVAISATAAKRIMDAGRPLRTIRVVWFGAEEVGIYGGTFYNDVHGREAHYAIAESDFGADRIWKIDSKLGPDRKGEADALAAAFAPLGIVDGSRELAGGPDLGPMLDAGQPGGALRQDGTRYFDLHHTPDDTLDKIDAQALRQNVAAWTAMLAVLSGGIEAPKPARRR